MAAAKQFLISLMTTPLHFRVRSTPIRPRCGVTPLCMSRRCQGRWNMLELLCRLCPMRHSEFRWRPIVTTTGPPRDKSILVIEWIRCATRRFRRDIVTADIYTCVSMRSGAARTLMSSSRDSTVARVRGMQCRKVPLQSVRIPSLPVGTPLCWTGDHTE